VVLAVEVLGGLVVLRVHLYCPAVNGCELSLFGGRKRSLIDSPIPSLFTPPEATNKGPGFNQGSGGRRPGVWLRRADSLLNSRVGHQHGIVNVDRKLNVSTGTM